MVSPFVANHHWDKKSKIIEHVVDTDDMLEPMQQHVMLTQYNKNHHYLQIGKCHEMVDQYTRESLLGLPEWQIAQLMSPSGNHINCYKVRTLYGLYVAQGYMYNPQDPSKI